MKLNLLFSTCILFWVFNISNINAQYAIKVSSVNRENPKKIMLRPKNQVALWIIDSQHKSGQRQLGGKILNIDSSGLRIKLPFSKKTAYIPFTAIYAIQKANLGIVLGVGMPLSVGAYLFTLNNSTNLPPPLIWVTPMVGFSIIYNKLISPPKKVNPLFYTKNNQWTISIIKDKP